ncbi:hypothetical protein ACFY2M_44315 [Streptomyces sp. NPDC001276]|uniref:hypothetical protein n=1 Tax=Streptomyces sp. NPDC001276 TaxID=3364555 RepID=UPI0036BC97A6
MITYASALAVAGVLTALVLLPGLRVEDVGGSLHLWTDYMIRGLLGLAGYVWITRRSRENSKT